MQRRRFFQTAALSAAALPLMGNAAEAQDGERECYEWRTYYLSGGGGRRQFLEYVQQALAPALQRNGARSVMAFEEIADPEPPVVFLLIAYPSLADFGAMPARLRADSDYEAASADYDGIEPGSRVYSRYDTALLHAFRSIPQMAMPPDNHALFELRTYESYNGDAARRKVAMFDDGELEIFYKTGLHPVFFGSMMAGPEMPALTYMLSFEDRAERDANWAKFIDHPDWKAMASDATYANTVSKIYRRFLRRIG